QGTDGEFNAKGSLVWNKEPVSFTFYVKSPRRFAQDGSPIDLNLTSPALTLAFSGRMAIDTGFNLSGQATAKSTDVRLLADWLGHPLTQGRGLQNLELAGNLEASEKRIAFREARLSLDGMRGQGELSLTHPDGKLRLDATLGMD